MATAQQQHQGTQEAPTPTPETDGATSITQRAKTCACDSDGLRCWRHAPAPLRAHVERCLVEMLADDWRYRDCAEWVRRELRVAIHEDTVRWHALGRLKERVQRRREKLLADVGRIPIANRATRLLRLERQYLANQDAEPEVALRALAMARQETEAAGIKDDGAAAVVRELRLLMGQAGDDEASRLRLLDMEVGAVEGQVVAALPPAGDGSAGVGAHHEGAQAAEADDGQGELDFGGSVEVGGGSAATERKSARPSRTNGKPNGSNGSERGVRLKLSGSSGAIGGG